MKHLKFLFALGGILFLSCQTVSARGLKIPFGDREVLTKVADLPDTEEYQTDDGNYSIGACVQPPSKRTIA